MDIRKLQRAIVDGLEDVKAQDIRVFNTEHLSPLFERVIIASGTSNRQTKALASGVRDAVKSAGFPIVSTEGQDNGEWIIVDCGAAVAHIMQPAIREYYNLEEIWGDKPVKLKAAAPRGGGLVKASEPMPDHEADAPAGKKAAGKKAAAKKSAARKAPGRAASPPVAAKKAPARKATAQPAPAKKAAARKAPAGKPEAPIVTIVVPARKAAAKRSAAKKAPAKKAAARKAPARKATAKKAPARKTASRA